MSSKEPLQTPLYSVHKRLGGKVIDFHGWLMPVQYSGIIEEHKRVRTNAGIFDLSHMGEFTVKGKGSLDFLQRLCTRNLANSLDGHAYYSCICNENGGTIDDLLVYRNSADDYLVVVNASNIDKDFEWFSRNCPSDVELKNISAQTALIAVQGPKAAGIIAPLVKSPVDDLYFYQHRKDEIAGEQVVLARTGYTGEDGFEVYVDADSAEKLWDVIWNQGQPTGMLPVGLGARDTLRLEMAYSLYGNEMDESVNPIEAGIGWAVSSKKEFIGSGVILPLKKNGTARRIRGFKLNDRGIPRQHYAVKAEGKAIGEVTSGTLSPSLNEGLGLAMIESRFAELGTEISVEIRGKDVSATVVEIPFVKSSVYKKS